MSCRSYHIVLVLWITFIPFYYSFPVVTKENHDEKLSFFEINDDVEFDEELYDEVIPNDDDTHDVKKSNKDSKRILKDRRNPDKPPLVLLEFPPEFGKEQVINLLKKHFGHLIDPEMMKNISNGNVNTIPSTWSFISNLDLKGAVVGAAAKHFLKDYKTIADHPVIKGISKAECKKECKVKENKVDHIMAAKLSHFIQRGLPDDDIRIRIRPSTKKYYKFETKDNESTCVCKDVKKNIYVSPRLMELISEEFFQFNNVEDRIDELMKLDPTFQDKADVGSSWSFGNMASKALYRLGLKSESEKIRRVVGDRFSKNRAAELFEYLLLHAFISFMLISFCPCLWPFHLFLAVYGFFRWL